MLAGMADDAPCGRSHRPSVLGSTAARPPVALAAAGGFVRSIRPNAHHDLRSLGWRPALIAALLLAAGPTPATADPDCTCRGPGGRLFHQGETTCLPSPDGPRLARCAMALNNTSWAYTKERCEPVAHLSPRRDRTARAGALQVNEKQSPETPPTL
ncbi:hypothetical protein [Methyloraptor flagellatus]|jgi:hypothetical protein|uniref:Uncharacterized protein n=1 Tax=Methyloraptor flagellatus TaxID=3162530 RepID=A0AAU7XET2_9HYPH